MPIAGPTCAPHRPSHHADVRTLFASVSESAVTAISRIDAAPPSCCSPSFSKKCSAFPPVRVLMSTQRSVLATEHSSSSSTTGAGTAAANSAASAAPSETTGSVFVWGDRSDCMTSAGVRRNATPAPAPAAAAARRGHRPTRGRRAAAPPHCEEGGHSLLGRRAVWNLRSGASASRGVEPIDREDSTAPELLLAAASALVPHMPRRGASDGLGALFKRGGASDVWTRRPSRRT